MNTVEVYDLLQMRWSYINNLPLDLSGAQLIEDGRGGVLIVGGYRHSIKYSRYSSDVFYLAEKDGIWKKTFKTLEHGRSRHAAMLIPDSFIQC